MLSAVNEEPILEGTQQPETNELTTKDLYATLPSDDENDDDFVGAETAEEEVDGDEIEEDEDFSINREEVAEIAIEAISLSRSFTTYRNTITQMQFQSDDEDDEYVDEDEVIEDSDSDISEADPIEPGEVEDNIINSNYVVRDELLMKNSKVLRDGRELASDPEFDSLSMRIANVLKQ